jgi:hypothetical protein
MARRPVLCLLLPLLPRLLLLLPQVAQHSALLRLQWHRLLLLLLSGLHHHGQHSGL